MATREEFTDAMEGAWIDVPQDFDTSTTVVSREITVSKWQLLRYSGKPGSPEFIEHQRQLGELYRELLAKNVEAENGRISIEIENRTYEQAMKLLPFEILDDSA